VAGGSLHCLALLEDGSLWGWGENSSGQIGINSRTDAIVPERIPEFLEEGECIKGIGCGIDFSWVVTQKGSLYMWGGERHVGMSPDSLVPRKHVFQVALPRISLETLWREVFFWMFLGRADPKSTFCTLPVEVVFEMTNIFV
jgi:hypothetical protein